MSNWKVLLAALLLMGILMVACGGVTPAPPAPPVPQTVVVPQTIVVPQTVVVSQTVVPPPAATPAPQAAPPVAVLQIVPVAANLKGDPNVFTSTIKIMTDTVVGPATAVVALGAPGLANTPLGVPVHLAVAPKNPKDTVSKISWVLTAPQDSKAAIKDPAAAATEFTPDVVGMYKVDATITNDAGSSLDSIQIHAGTFIGTTAGGCQKCHADNVAEWSKTGHAVIFTDQIDIKNGDYSETCIRCHTTGYYPGVANGGFADAQAQAKWQFPTTKQIIAGGNWNAAPAAVKNMANIQCESCHGPAKEHVTNGQNVMSVSMDNGTCNVCHNGGGHHIKGTELNNAAHSDATSAAFTVPTGPSEQACVRCHSGAGYVTFVANPTNQAAWNNSMQTIGCSTCHDPHSDKNPHQLRVFGTPISLPFDAKDVGLSATCFECHNNRSKPADAIKSSFPHYSSVSEFLSNTGGVDYGKTIPDSPHGSIVGVAPIPNPAFAKDPETNQFLFSAVGDTKGVTPGPCVTCHMWDTITDAKDPNYLKVGAHSFNTVSPDGKFDYTAACQQCHAGMKDFNFAAKADYDGNGKVEGVQDEVTGLLNVLWKALQDKGLKKIDTGYPYATLPKDASGNVDPKIANAWYNYRVVYGVMWSSTDPGNQGKAQAIHDFNRAVSLLQLSYKDLTGQDVQGATILVK